MVPPWLALAAAFAAAALPAGSERAGPEAGAARAWSLRATALYRLARDEPGPRTEALFREALVAADRAVELAPQLPDGWLVHAELAQAIRYDWLGAWADYERARALGADEAALLPRWGTYLAALGRTEEAVAVLERAASLDPLSADVATDLAVAYLQQGDLVGARAASERALRLSSSDPRATRTLGLALLLDGRFAGARAAFHRSADAFHALMGDAMVEHALGHPAESWRAIERMFAWPDVENGAWQLARVFAWRGEPDRAFEWLKTAFHLHDPGLAELKGDPVMRPLASDPRFAALLRDLNLPE